MNATGSHLQLTRLQGDGSGAWSAAAGAPAKRDKRGRGKEDLLGGQRHSAGLRDWPGGMARENSSASTVVGDAEEVQSEARCGSIGWDTGVAA